MIFADYYQSTYSVLPCFLRIAQLLFLYSPCFGGREWFAGVLANFPAEQTAMSAEHGTRARTPK